MWGKEIVVNLSDRIFIRISCSTVDQIVAESAFNASRQIVESMTILSISIIS